MFKYRQQTSHLMGAAHSSSATLNCSRWVISILTLNLIRNIFVLRLANLKPLVIRRWRFSMAVGHLEKHISKIIIVPVLLGNMSEMMNQRKRITDRPGSSNPRNYFFDFVKIQFSICDQVNIQWLQINARIQLLNTMASYSWTGAASL